jgi:hypothetical protein
MAAIRSEALGDKAIAIEGCDTREKETREWLQARIDSRDKAITSVRDRLINRMSDFRREFEAETREIDAAVESAGEFRQLLDRLRGDDLPRFEQRFKELLNQNTIREIANFNAHLNQQRETIRERVTRINQSLIEIDYNPGRYIVLEATPVPDQDIRAFRTELRSCTEGALTGSEDDQYSEAKFLQVKSIIERFRDKPERIRIRFLDPACAIAPERLGLDLTLDSAAFAVLDPPVERVFITENEVNFLAFPNCPRSLVIFGSGYGWSALAAASWLHQRAIHYWGDIATHGFAILDQLRSCLPHVRSMLMNREVLLHHREFWTTEPNSVRHELPRLTADEKFTLEALKANSGVAAPRMEQEKLPFSILQNALRQVLDGFC